MFDAQRGAGLNTPFPLYEKTVFSNNRVIINDTHFLKLLFSFQTIKNLKIVSVHFKYIFQIQ